jgi:hypothetical protein
MTTEHKVKSMSKLPGLAMVLASLVSGALQAQQVSTVISNSLNEPNYITADPHTNTIVYVTDSSHNRIMRLDANTTNLTLLAGSGSGAAGTNNGTGLGASFSQPLGIVFDAHRNGLVVVDSANQTLRLVTTAGAVSTIAGIPATLLNPNGGNSDGALGVGQLSYPVGVATDNGGNLYIADAGNNELRVLNAANVLSTIVITNVEMNGAPLADYSLDGAAALAFDAATRNLWVADSRHQTICLITNINALNNTLFVVAGTPGLRGTNDSTVISSALFNLPRGLLWDASVPGLLISDTGNDTIRELTGSLAGGFAVQTLAGSPLSPGLVDGALGVAQFNQPVGLTFDVTDNGYYLVDRGNNAVRKVVVVPVVPPSSVPPETEPVAAPTFTPNSGYFSNCVTIVVDAGVPDIYYTLNGTTPAANNGFALTLSNNPAGGFQGSFQYCNAEQNLSIIQMIAINGTNFSSITFGQPPNANVFGVPFSQTVGAGSTVIIPVEANLKAGVTLESIQYRLEIATNGNAPMLPALTYLPPPYTNNFVPVTGLAPLAPNTNIPGSFNTYSVSATGTQGLEFEANPFVATGATVFALVAVTIPTNAVQGQSYTVSVINPSGTSDGAQTTVPLLTIPAQTLVISNLQYFVGDTSPGGGYSAGEFGDGLLQNSDVNNALLASVGVRPPYPNTDAFNAMDVWPPDTANNVGGDGFITMLDWETILFRSLSLDTNNWVRYWTNSAAGAVLAHAPVGWTNGIAEPIGIPNIHPNLVTPPGQVWVPNATFNAGTVSGLTPGGVASIPVSVTVQPGSTLQGMQFRAVVSPTGGAPVPAQIVFTPAAGIPSPTVLAVSTNDIACFWPLPLGGNPGLGLQGSNLVGSISFTVPAGAASGQSYSLHFVGADGVPNINTKYQLESVPGSAGIGSAILTAQITSDEWRMSFFGSTTSPQAQDNADPDGDGVPNWQEYLAGTNPTNAASCLRLGSTTGAAHQVNLTWLTAPGKNYVLQSSATLTGGWTPVNSNSGDGNLFQVSVTNQTGSARFYRIQLQQ